MQSFFSSCPRSLPYVHAPFLLGGWILSALGSCKLHRPWQRHHGAGFLVDPDLLGVLCAHAPPPASPLALRSCIWIWVRWSQGLRDTQIGSQG
ncbi:unnamed protein product [Mycena citricolor]|uniref:Uncharacterized protein n=1 Tax=Mycena citricolor TaxID=2018698 RepID=A0AAD2K578_9AGAR|nr:unnamed protein product [Mycena citricolor]